MSFAKLSDVVIATTNSGKFKEFQQLLHGLPFRLHSLSDYPNIRTSEEPFSTYAENAFDKALKIAHQVHLPVIADDSGLEIAAFQGRPGVQSARFLPEYLSFLDKSKWILEHLNNHDSRNAQFVCALALVYPDGKSIAVEAICPGRIAEHHQGSQGFGYDPIFIPEGHHLTFAELPSALKNQLSHRGRAVQLLIKQCIEKELI